MTLALSDTSDPITHGTSDDQTKRAVTEIGRLADQSGRRIVELAGALHHIDEDAAQQMSVVTRLTQQSQELTQISAEMTDGLNAVAGANSRALETVEASIEGLRTATQNSQEVAKWVGQMDHILGEVENTLSQVTSANARIAKIAKQVNILAVNAKIEAARAGDLGKGFAVVAEAINTLSQETSSAATDVTGSTGTLTGLIGTLREDARSVSQRADAVIADATTTDTALSDINRDVSDASGETAQLSNAANAVSNAVADLAPSFEQLSGALRTTSQNVTKATAEADDLVDISETTVQLTVQMGASNSDGALIELVQDGAARITALFEGAIAARQISLNALFDSDYKRIEDSNPPQVLAAFTALTDQLLPDLLDPMLEQDARIVFCAAIDRNGYLPTHNAKFSHPQGADPLWNAANCRNRRIFDDRVGLKSGRNTSPFLMQSYRRDMGGGQFVLMKDLSAPIFVEGRHWGGLRMGFAPDA